MADFFAMGGYGAYVWPAYLITAAVLLAVTILIVRRSARARERLASLEQKKPDATDE